MNRVVQFLRPEPEQATPVHIIWTECITGSARVGCVASDPWVGVELRRTRDTTDDGVCEYVTLEILGDAIKMDGGFEVRDPRALHGLITVLSAVASSEGAASLLAAARPLDDVTGGAPNE